jgi:hypothetical protein
MRPDQQQGEAERSVDVMRTMQRSHNSARLTAEEHPRSAALADHAADTKLAMDAVAEYIAANDEYDAAKMAHSQLINAEFGHGHFKAGEAWRAFRKAEERRALAHARMKGEEK